MLFAWITDPNAWLALGTLTLLEIVLGIDNIIFLSLVVANFPRRNETTHGGLGWRRRWLCAWRCWRQSPGSLG